MTPSIQTLFRENERLWDEHCHAAYVQRDADRALASSAGTISVVNIPMGTGGQGLEEVRQFYAERFLPHLPEDLTRTPISRTVDRFRLVDESTVSFTHDRELPWLLPDVAATNQVVRVLTIGIIGFQQGKIVSQRILWNHADLLSQLGSRLPDRRGA